MKALEQWIENYDAKRVLDVATGGGEFINIIMQSKAFERITAIDVSEKPREILKKKYPNENISFFVMDAAKMDFPDNSFDTVCLSNSLHHLVSPFDVLAEMWRVVKPSGYIIINEMYSDNQTAARESHVLIHHWFAKFDRLRGVCHNETFAKKKIIELVSTLPGMIEKVIEYEWPAEITNNEEYLQYYLTLCDQEIERIEKSHYDDTLISEGKMIKEHLKKYGFASAASLFILMKK